MTSGDHAQGGGIGETVITARSFDEYRAMFALTRGDLERKILDCPGGAAGFTSEINALGGSATACDLVYSQHAVDDLAMVAEAETDRGNRYVRANSGDYVWKFFADPSEHQRARQEAVRTFAADVRRSPHRYVAARLPSLPFADACFDLVLSSHLLFSYTDRLSHAFHVDAIGELVRVARDEVRIFPLVAIGESDLYPRLDSLLESLRSRGIDAHVVEVDYEFQRGANHMLCLRKVFTGDEQPDEIPGTGAVRRDG